MLTGKIIVQGELGPKNIGLFTYNDWLYNLTRITPENMLAFSPVWSPNGKVIAFVYSDLEESDFRIAIMDVDSKKTGVILNRGIGNLLIQEGTSLAWSPDGNSLMFDLVGSDNCHYLFVYNVEKRKYQQASINFCQGKTIYPIINKLDISWSPGDAPLIGVSYQGDWGSRGDIYLADQALTKVRLITNGSYPIWRIGEQDFSYVCWKSPSSIPAICLYSPDRGPLSTIVESYGYDKYTWSPDRRYILFVDVGHEIGNPSFLSAVDVNAKEKYNLLRLKKSPLTLFDLLIPFPWDGGEATWSAK